MRLKVFQQETFSKHFKDLGATSGCHAALLQLRVSDGLKNHWRGCEQKPDLILRENVTSLLARFTLLLTGQLRHTKEKQQTQIKPKQSKGK